MVIPNDTFDIYESLLWGVCPDCMNPGPPFMLVNDLLKQTQQLANNPTPQRLYVLSKRYIYFFFICLISNHKICLYT